MNKKTIILTWVLISGLAGCKSQIDEMKESQSTTTNIVAIEYNQNATSDGDVIIDNSQVTITKSGTYSITGESDDAQVIIEAPEESITLILDDLTLTSEQTSAISVIDAKELTIELKGESNLSDTKNNTDEYQAPLFIDEVKTTIQGEGILNLVGNYKEGLESNNDLYIEGGTINVTAVDDGINVGDLLEINGGTINVDSKGDGIDSNGDLIINGGVMYVSGGNDITRAEGALDFNQEEGYKFELTGGTIISAGGTMAVVPTVNNQEYNTYYASGSQIEIGEYTYDVPKDFSFVFISYSGLTNDEKLIVDGTSYSEQEAVIRPQGQKEQDGRMAPR